MSMVKLALMMLAAGGLVVFSGCAVTNYHASGGSDEPVKLSSPRKYNIVHAETVYLKAFDENNRLPALELDFLDKALKNQPGTAYGEVWQKGLPALEGTYGYLNIRSEDTADMKLSARSSNPVIFDDTPDAMAVQVKTVAVFSPEVVSPGWTTSYVLLVTMSPMKKYNYGAMLVAVTDTQGKTIGTRVIGVYRTMWFSALLPTALFACGELSADRAFFHDMSADEKAMQTALVVQAVTEILGGKADTGADPQWRNIRAAVVEALAVGNEDAAVKLLKAARDQQIGGEELNAFLKMMGE